MSFKIYNLVELGEVSFGMLNLGELWNIQVGCVRKVSFGIYKLGEESFGMLKLSELG